MNQDSASPLEFTGSGNEYFRIWIVNIALTILTLGIYSAWAKVRRMKYFYQNTRLAGSAFNYHGEPGAILKGRIIALGLLIAWTYVPLDRAWGIAAWIGLAALWPWLIVRSMHFKRRNSSWRGIHFRFDGLAKEVYLPAAILLGLSFVVAWGFYPEATEPEVKVNTTHALLGLGALVLSLALTPYFHHFAQRFFVVRTLFGGSRFGFDARAGQFYSIYWRLALVGAAALVGIGLLAGVMFAAALRQSGGVMILAGIGILLLVYGMVLFVGPYFTVRIQNLIWNNLSIGGHRFESNARVRDLFWITLRNLFFVVITLGLYRPYAVIRVLRYRVEAIRLLPQGDLDSFVGQAQQAVSALGEEAAEMFDIDLAV